MRVAAPHVRIGSDGPDPLKIGRATP
jgi:hypothetical protein